MAYDHERDRRYMAAAVALARRGLGHVWPNPSVGALIVDESGETAVVRGRGVTQPPGGPHAEISALRQAGESARGATCFVTLEPCAHQGRTGPCSAALTKAGVARVVIGVIDPNPRVAGDGVAMLRAAGVQVDVGVGADLCRAHHARHILRVQNARPRVVLKLAVSRDGYIGVTGKGQIPITGADARRQVQLLRAQSDAILVGVGTVLADDPLLTCRLPGLEELSPVRVVLDPAAKLPLDAQLVSTARAHSLWLIVGDDADVERTDALRRAGVEVVRVPLDGRGHVAPAVVLRALGQRGVTQVLVEGGAFVAADFLESGVIDEVMIFHGCDDIGAQGVLPFAEAGLEALLKNPSFAKVDARSVGRDRLEIYMRKEL